MLSHPMAATKPSDSARILRRVAGAALRSKEHKERQAALDAERDEAIREAIAAKVPRAEIVAATRLSPARIDQIWLARNGN